MEEQVMTEQQIQAKCFIWHWNTYPNERRMLFHADNNSANALVGNRKKASGVVKGVSDMVLITLCGTVYLEFKTPTGVQSAEQKDFAAKVRERGSLYFIVRSVEQFQKLIKEFYEQ